MVVQSLDWINTDPRSTPTWNRFNLFLVIFRCSTSCCEVVLLLALLSSTSFHAMHLFWKTITHHRRFSSKMNYTHSHTHTHQLNWNDNIDLSYSWTELSHQTHTYPWMGQMIDCRCQHKYAWKNPELNFPWATQLLQRSCTAGPIVELSICDGSENVLIN